MKNSKYAYMTTLTNERYIGGVKALIKSLRNVKTKYDIVILLPEDNEKQLLEQLKNKHILSKQVYTLTQPKLNVEPPEGIVMKDHYWNETFFKLQTIKCTMFEKLILIDSDMIVMRNIDHLFRSPSYSATVAGKCVYHEWVNPNSGLMVIEPSNNLYENLMKSIKPAIKRRYELGLDVGDQDVFYQAFPDWEKRKDLYLPEIYNVFWFCVDIACKYYKCDYSDYYVVHFMGTDKPWLYSYLRRIKIMIAFWLKKEYWKAKVFSYYVF